MHYPFIISKIDDVNIKKSNAHHHGVWLGGRSLHIISHNTWQELSD